MLWVYDPEVEIRKNLGMRLSAWRPSQDIAKCICGQMKYLRVLGELWREALAPSNIMGTPKYWMEDWKSRWDEVGRCGMRQWTWDVTGTH